MYSAVLPLWVNAAIAVTGIMCDASMACCAMHSSIEWGGKRGPRVDEDGRTFCFSVSRQVRCIASTASSGYFPAAVSPESMIASVPSSTALATSLTSARVGIGFSHIDSIICVATITGVQCFGASRMMRFCTGGTEASPISTPRSPRATITASDASRILSRFSTASARSTLATSPALEPSARTSERA